MTDLRKDFNDLVIMLVCGGRDRLDWNKVVLMKRVLGLIHERFTIDVLIHGGAKGVDSEAGRWADDMGIQTASFRISQARWKTVGASAGPLRNRMMLRMRPSQVIAFPGGPGTADMVQAAREAGIYTMAFRSWETVGKWNGY